MLMHTLFYPSLAGFLFCFIMLFYFISKYRGDDEVQPEEKPQEPEYSPIAEIEPLPAAEPSQPGMGDVAESVLEMQNIVEQKTGAQDTRIDGLINEINETLAAVEKLDPKQMQQIQPSINALMTELESLRNMQEDGTSHPAA